MAATLGQLGSGTFGAFSTQDLAPPKPKAPKSLDEQLVESAEAEASMVKEKEKGQAQEKATLAKGEETLAKETAEKIRTSPTRALIEEKTIERADKKFVPNKETAGDLGTLFTITNLMGFMIGGKGKGNATAALSAMNGMLEGHQKGRQDLYNKEKAVYDENIKTLDKTIDSLYKKMQDDLQLYSVDRDAGMAALRTTAAQHNATLVSDMMEKYGPIKPFQVVKAMVDLKDKRIAAEQKLAQHEQDRLDRLYKEDQELRRRKEHDQMMYAIAQDKKKPKDESTLGNIDTQKAYLLGLPIPQSLPYSGRSVKENQAILGIELRKAEDFVKKERERAEKADQTITDMTQAMSILNRITTGKPGATGMGYYQNMNNAESKMFEAISNNDQRNQYIKGEGALSDKEREQMAKTTFNLSNPVETNRRIIEQKLEGAKLNKEKSDFIDKYVGTYLTSNGAEGSWNQYMTANPFFERSADPTKPVEINKNRKAWQDYFRTQLTNEVQHGR
jgi:hypothetical protein